jgi:hypothetical protein
MVSIYKHGIYLQTLYLSTNIAYIYKHCIYLQTLYLSTNIVSIYKDCLFNCDLKSFNDCDASGVFRTTTCGIASVTSPSDSLRERHSTSQPSQSSLSLIKTFYDCLLSAPLFTEMLLQSMEHRPLKIVNNCLNTNTNSYFETSGFQSSNIYLKVVYFFSTSVNWTSVAA